MFFVVLVIVAALAFPVINRLRERGRRMGCEANLREIGGALNRYRTTNSQRMPCGSAYHAPTSTPGVSWWLDVLAFNDQNTPTKEWKRDAPHAGDFSVASVNGNIAIADGFQPTIFFCPSSPLPYFNDPERHISPDNRRALGRTAKGIPVPMYVAVAGSAPDAVDYDRNPDPKKANPWGRNTKDSFYGILSSSGMFPPNVYIDFAQVRDMQSRVIMVGEQSNYLIDNKLDPVDQYDPRSAWPRGAFMGSEGAYGQIGTTRPGLNGDGDRRCWNLTTIRYPLNFQDFKAGGLKLDPPPPRPAKEGDPPPQLPPYPPEGYGPGHNHPLVSGHPGGVQVLMADGSVPFLNEELDLTLLLRMSTRDDGVNVEIE